MIPTPEYVTSLEMKYLDLVDYADSLIYNKLDLPEKYMTKEWIERRHNNQIAVFKEVYKMIIEKQTNEMLDGITSEISPLVTFYENEL